ncbi:unnamed protein product [Cuscuta campestris]|uniref:Uncharacterized protein n=1 Tax=Cuscuta campestris TaxID=132261 RepID=A0A484LWI1_9ASTE|nr:unnamed protein product [Cuscuta campestris]
MNNETVLEAARAKRWMDASWRRNPSPHLSIYTTHARKSRERKQSRELREQSRAAEEKQYRRRCDAGSPPLLRSPGNNLVTDSP